MSQRCDKDEQRSQEYCKPEPPRKGRFDGVLELPPFLRRIGPRQIQSFTPFVKSIGTYSLAGIICLLYMTDWKAVLQYLPYYAGKFHEEEPPAPVPKKQIKEASEEPKEE